METVTGCSVDGSACSAASSPSSVDSRSSYSRWRSEMDLKTGNNSAAAAHLQHLNSLPSSEEIGPKDRKVSPHFSKLLSESRIRSGSDPSLILMHGHGSRRDGSGGNRTNTRNPHQSQDENKRPFTSFIAGSFSSKSRGNSQHKNSPESSPKMGKL